MLKGIPLDVFEVGGGAGSNTVISPRFFREFCLPYDKIQNAALHAVGMRIVYHLCGGLMQMLDLVDGYIGRMLHTLLLIALLTHAYLGVKLIVEDYVHMAALRIPMMGALLIGLAGFGIWWLSVIWAWAA